jgi:hypothetical protein
LGSAAQLSGYRELRSSIKAFFMRACRGLDDAENRSAAELQSMLSDRTIPVLQPEILRAA